MKPFGKVGVSLLSLLLLATPIMACLVPAAAMTAAERDCCKRMAEECGKAGMPQSHSCCQTTTVPDHMAAIKSSSDMNSQHPTLFVAYAISPELTIAVVSEFGSSPWAADIHSPPVSPHVAISILRI
jgi:3-methyladenine DNA glycosylase AlkC